MTGYYGKFSGSKSYEGERDKCTVAVKKRKLQYCGAYHLSIVISKKLWERIRYVPT